MQQAPHRFKINALLITMLVCVCVVVLLALLINISSRSALLMSVPQKVPPSRSQLRNIGADSQPDSPDGATRTYSFENGGYGTETTAANAPFVTGVKGSGISLTGPGVLKAYMKSLTVDGSNSGFSFFYKPTNPGFLTNNYDCQIVKYIFLPLSSGASTDFISISKNASNQLQLNVTIGGTALTPMYSDFIPISQSFSTDQGYTAQSAWDTNTWHQLGIFTKRDGGLLKITLYIDGYKALTQTYNTFLPVSSGQYSLQFRPFGLTTCSYALDEVKFYNFSPRSEEIEAGIERSDLATVTRTAPSNGVVSVSTPSNPTYSTVSFTLNTSATITTNGGIRLALPHSQGWGSNFSDWLSDPVQISASSTNGTQFQIARRRYITSSNVVEFKPNQDLPTGSTVNITLANLVSPRWTGNAEPFRFLVDTGTGYYYLLPKPYPSVIVRSNVARSLYLRAPSQIVDDEEFDLIIRAEDDYRNLAYNHTSNMTLSLAGAASGATVNAASCMTCQGGQGIFVMSSSEHGLKRLRVSTMGAITGSTIQIQVFDSTLNATYKSTPIKVISSTDSSPKIYWGNLHQHTKNSDGRGTPAEHYDIARYESGLDFSAVIDHMGWENSGVEHRYIDQTLNDQEIDENRNAAITKNADGTFVTFYGFEYRSEVPGDVLGVSTEGSSGQVTYSELDKENEDPRNPNTVEMNAGDWNMYFLDPNSTLIPEYDLRRILSRAVSTNQQVIIYPHHMGPSPLDNFSDYYPRLSFYRYSNRNITPVIDICRAPGRVEPFGQVALSLGYRVGFVGSDDDHTGHPGRNVWELRTGGNGECFIAVLSTALTRQGIFSAIRNRNTYAATHKGMLLDVKMSTSPTQQPSVLIGQSVSTNSRYVKIRGTVGSSGVVNPNASGADRGKIEIVKAQIISSSRSPSDFSPEIIQVPASSISCPASNSNTVCSFEFVQQDYTQNPPSANSNYSNGVLYYVRFNDHLNRQAWSSPFFIDYQ